MKDIECYMLPLFLLIIIKFAFKNKNNNLQAYLSI